MANQKPPKEDFSLKETSPNISGRRVSTGPMTAFDLVEHMQYLYVRVVKARGLPAIADPYVELKLGNYRAITRPMVKNPNPEWNQVFAFSKDRIQVVSVEILVKDKAVVAEGGDHRTIGKFAFALVEAPARVPPDSPLAPQWYMLEDKNKARIGGELMLSFWIGTQADEAFPEAWHADVAAVSGDGVSSTRSKVYLSPRLWYMRVNVIQAQDLVLKDKNKKTPEFFVKAQFGNLILRSGVSPNKTVNPTWNEDLMFVVAEPFDDPLVVSVEEKLNNNKEESMGRIVVPLGDVAKRNDAAAAAAPKWYNLGMVEVAAGVQKEVKFASKVQMRVSLDGGYHVLDEPAHSTSDLRPTAKILWKPPIGVLELGILNATGLSPMKPKNQVDAYCVAKYGMKWVRTRTVVDSSSPKWNEQYTWEVYDPCTVITIGVFDNGNLQDKAAMDLNIGKVKIRLSTLETDRIYTHSYPLVALQPSGVKKMGEIQLAVRFSCPNMLNLLQLYSQPLLPKMHYVLPLSIYQLASLRHQAALILWLRLSRAEPPLRKEVVDCMLDATAHLWSFRRGKANFDRIIKLFDGLVALFKWFDQIRKWTNPLASALVYITFVFVLCQPGLTIAAAFLCLSFRGALNYRKRPRQIAHIDTELSHAYDVHPEDLDEEFDSFPSKKTGDVLKRRYDRLRGIAGRIQAVLGDIATQGERMQSLLSWRDPRATALFVIFCLIVGIVFCVVPAWWLALFAGTYVMRPPYWRINIPTFPQNFLRRMPAKSDSIL